MLVRKRLTLTLEEKRTLMKNRIQGISREVRARAETTQGQRLSVSARCMGLDRKSGTFRADLSLKRFSWENEG